MQGKCLFQEISRPGNTIIQTDINLKVLTGNIDGICRAINLELKTAFSTFLRITDNSAQNQLGPHKTRPMPTRPKFVRQLGPNS